MLLLFRCLTREGRDGEELASVQDTDFVPSLEETNESLNACACSGWLRAQQGNDKLYGRTEKIEILER